MVYGDTIEETLYESDYIKIVKTERDLSELIVFDPAHFKSCLNKRLKEDEARECRSITVCKLKAIKKELKALTSILTQMSKKVNEVPRQKSCCWYHRILFWCK